MPRRWPRCATCTRAGRRSALRRDLREDPEARAPARDLRELRVATAELVSARLVARRHLDLVHLLHAADVRVSPRLVRVDERTGPAEARRRVDDLVTVNLAAAALDLV